jgi:retron-type reverse transcriptase
MKGRLSCRPFLLICLQSRQRLEHRIGDKRIIRLIQKWLRAGILEDGVVTVDDRGTGQSSVVLPILANIYLHYCFDLWAERCRRQEARGDMIVVRYADDLVVVFPSRCRATACPSMLASVQPAC